MTQILNSIKNNEDTKINAEKEKETTVSKKQQAKLKTLLNEDYGKKLKESICKDIVYNVLDGNFYQKGIAVSEDEMTAKFLGFGDFLIKQKNVPIKSEELFYKIAKTYLPKINPIEDFLTDLKNCKTKESGHIEKLLSCFTLDESNGMTKDFLVRYFRKWLIGCIAQWSKAQNPNVLFLILIGETDLGKTYFFRSLLPSFLESFFGEKDKTSNSDFKSDNEKFASKLLYYIDDMKALNISSEEDIRQMVSAKWIEYKRPYAKGNSRYWRNACFCGSSNVKTIIKDVKNNRRIVPIQVIRKDEKIYDSIDKHLLWVEAFQAFANWESYELDKEERLKLIEIGENNEVEDDLKSVIKERFEKYDIEKHANKDLTVLTATQIYEELQGLHLKMCTPTQINKKLDAMGFSFVEKHKTKYWQVVKKSTIQEIEQKNKFAKLAKLKASA